MRQRLLPVREEKLREEARVSIEALEETYKLGIFERYQKSCWRYVIYNVLPLVE